jgi:predicted HD phosphohydrolase
MILVHQDFQGAHYYHHFGGDPNARETHRDELTQEEWDLASQFADDWDQTSFDPDYDTLPLEHFEDKVRQVFAAAKMFPTKKAGSRYDDK